ncbi:MAG: methyltransferase domain-containing protein [Firmicutes bacterium]|nr:methyltransferase domain-containing protein [Bacillota bacterium]
MAQTRGEKRLFGRSREKLASVFIKDEKIRPNVMLKYYLDLSGTDYLHWGYWEEGAELSLENFQAAQDRYAEELFKLIPPGVEWILDVGCGVGGNAKKLKEKGYKVAGLAPDPYQEQLFKERTGGEIPFLLTTFQDYKPERPYDLVLMSESVQYIPLDMTFVKAKEVLPTGGYLLTSDYYRLESSKGVKEHHLPSIYLQDFLEEAESQGFEILKQEDISAAVLPTLHYGQMLFSRYIKPTFSAQLLALKVHLPLGYKILKSFLRLRIKGEAIETIIRNNLVPLHPEVFSKYMKYLIILFRKK